MSGDGSTSNERPKSEPLELKVGQPVQFATYDLVKTWHPGVVAALLDGGVRVSTVGDDGEMHTFPCAWGSVKP
jgi:hypothetical protein